MAIAHTQIPWKAISNDGDPFHFYLYSPKSDAVILWIDRRNDVSVAHLDRTEADAEFIERAVNAHDALVEALEGMIAAYWTGSEDYDPPPHCVQVAKKAIILAKGA